MFKMNIIISISISISIINYRYSLLLPLAYTRPCY